MTETTVSRQAALDDEALTAALGALTLEEKVQLLTGRDFWNTWPIEKIGLRRILVSDGPSGVRGEAWDERDPSLNLPSATALASAWDPEIARRYGAAAAVEARRKGVDVVLGPTINLHRSPLGGRHFESLSEDPVLTAELAASYVKGAQDNGVGATPKHYIANDSETDRFTVDARVSDRALHELYLLAFEKAITEAHAWLVMSAYNSVNGVTATENALLETPLNSEWGFDGVVISDWTAVRSLESAKAAQDLVMPGPEGPWGAALVEAVRAGQIDESVVDRKVLRILRLAQRVGALEGTSPVEPALVEDGATFAREAAVAGTVLLANNGILPLDAHTAPGRGDRPQRLAGAHPRWRVGDGHPGEGRDAAAGDPGCTPRCGGVVLARRGRAAGHRRVPVGPDHQPGNRRARGPRPVPRGRRERALHRGPARNVVDLLRWRRPDRQGHDRRDLLDLDARRGRRVPARLRCGRARPRLHRRRAAARGDRCRRGNRPRRGTAVSASGRPRR